MGACMVVHYSSRSINVPEVLHMECCLRLKNNAAVNNDARPATRRVEPFLMALVRVPPRRRVAMEENRHDLHHDEDGNDDLEHPYVVVYRGRIFHHRQSNASAEIG